MSKKKLELLRLQSIIEEDRLDYNDNFLELFKSDVCKLFNEYFEYNANPIIEIEKNNKNLILNINLVASRIKNFAILPKD